MEDGQSEGRQRILCIYVENNPVVYQFIKLKFCLNLVLPGEKKQNKT